MISEYESTQLAALLHDIGKFLQRGTDIREKHHALSAVFVENFAHSFSQPELVKTIVGHHHEGPGTNPEDKPEAIQDPHTRALALLVCRADNFASSERAESGLAAGYQARAALDCVFSHIDIGFGLAENTPRYPLSRLYTKPAYPTCSLPSQHEIQDYEAHLEWFQREFAELFPAPYPGMCDTMLSLIQKYLWCVPSDTTRELRDVSLADHMKVTCAIASCMYKYHEEKGWEESFLKNDDLERLRLVCGDISGIQSYIYEIAKIGTGGVAKRLRARSFRISLLTEAIALRILKALNLPLACRIMAAGGQFYLLAPNTETAVRTLDSEQDLISKWLLDNFMGEIAISIAHTVVNAAELRQGEFDNALQRARSLVAHSKMRKFHRAIEHAETVFELNYESRGACACCDRRPADEASDLCDVCQQDELIGRQLASAAEKNYWLRIKESADGVIQLPGGWSAEITVPDHRDDCVLAYNLTNSGLLSGIPCAFFPYAGHVPKWTIEEYDQLSHKEKEDEPDRETVASGSGTKSFSALARSSDGAPYLGVLKADVDHLGLVFTLGTRGTASVSRLATISSFLHDFFTSELIRLVRAEYPNTYVVYSGGDDVMLVGPWSDLIPLSFDIRNALSDFTGNNPNITISAGIGTFRRNSPIALTAQMTSDILECSKSLGRNSLTLFGTTLKWDEFPKLEDWTNCLFEAAKPDSGESKISSSFLYRLLGYHTLAVGYFKRTHESPARAAMFRPYLAYDIARNLDEEKVRDKPHLQKLRSRLLELIEGGLEEWKLLGAALTWCLYKLRKEGE